MSTSNKIKEHLISLGFNPYNSEVAKKLYDCEWSMYKRTKYEDVKECLTNDKPPQIGVYYYSFKLGDILHESYTVELCQENDIGWVKFEYYGLSSKDILDRYEMIEKSLIASWEASWSDKQ